MKVEITDFVAGAREALGTVVVIDVFRAFSTACYLFAAGAQRIIAVGEIEKALELSDTLPGSLLVGERGGRKLDGFDFGNSPSEVENQDLSGKTVIQTTHAGTQGIVNAVQADEILTGSLVNARATCRHIRASGAGQVTLVRMGLHATSRSDEDDLCAEYLAALLLDQSYDISTIETRLRESPFSDRFFDPAKPWSPEADFHRCLEIDRFDFAIRAILSDGDAADLERIAV